MKQNISRSLRPKKHKRKSLTVTAVCKTQEEYLIMMIIIVYCQHFYRKLKKTREPITINKIIAKARESYKENKRRQPANERSLIIWR